MVNNSFNDEVMCNNYNPLNVNKLKIFRYTFSNYKRITVRIVVISCCVWSILVISCCPLCTPLSRRPSLRDTRNSELSATAWKYQLVEDYHITFQVPRNIFKNISRNILFSYYILLNRLRGRKYGQAWISPRLPPPSL